MMTRYIVHGGVVGLVVLQIGVFGGRIFQVVVWSADLSEWAIKNS